MQITNSQPIIDVKNVSKRFPGVRALHNVNVNIFPGEVLAVIGENGAGKSTLMKILAGVQEPDSGEILVDGKPAKIDSVDKAQRLGIALIHQELNLADNLDVGANIFLGREPRTLGFVRDSVIRNQSKQYLDAVGLDISPDTIAQQLSIGQQQMVEIAKALSIGARILIMDEPTSSLSKGETEKLYHVIDDLRSKGVSIVYISHRLGEVVRLADRVTVLRDGENAGQLQKESITHDSMVRLMVGRDVSQFYSRHGANKRELALQVENIVTRENPAHTVSLDLKGGEIVGIAGLVGAGRTELLNALFGIHPVLSGSIRIDGKPVENRGARYAINSGMVLVPEDRKQQGVILDQYIRDNTSLPGLYRNHRFGFVRRQFEEKQAVELIERLNIKTPSSTQVVRYLSGGNQQKVVLAKWLALKPKILLLDEPTRGVDIGAKQDIYKILDQLANQGVAILFASSELEEILGISDRVLVMHEGCLAGELSRSQLSEEAVMQLATGQNLAIPI
jgi:ribose transport system ATP-binding protein